MNNDRINEQKSVPVRGKWRTWAILTGIVLCLTAFAACGSKQTPQSQEQSASCEETSADGSCIGDEWAKPPKEVGETPPPKAADDSQLEPFESNSSRENGE